MKKMSLPQIASHSHLMFEQVKKSAFERENPPLTCTKGCSACCKQLVLMTLSEGALVAERYPLLLSSKRDIIEAQEKRLGEIKVAIGMPDEPDTESMKKLSEAWWAEQQNCAFLENNQCRIYDSRPMACRQLYIVDDPKLCADIEPQDVRGWRPMEFAYPTLTLFELEADLVGQTHLGTMQTIFDMILNK